MGSDLWQSLLAQGRLYAVGFVSIVAVLILLVLVVRRWLRSRRELRATHATYEGLRIEPDPSEYFADLGNNHVRKIFGRSRVISYAEYKKWRAKNATIFTAVSNDKNELVGFFDIFPLTDAAGAALISGEKAEPDLSIDDVLSGRETPACNYVYIATLAARYRNPLLDVLLTRALVSHLNNALPPRPGRQYLIIPYTKVGRNAAIRNGFRCEADRSKTKKKTEVYCLDSADARRAIERLTRHAISGTNERFSANTFGRLLPSNSRIFLSYRRADDPGFALALYQQLTAIAGEGSVFMDIEGTIKPGENFTTVLRRALTECDVLLAVIGPRWLTHDFATSLPRIHDPNDWVRAEIAEAFAMRKRIVPVIVGDGAMPSAAHLPLDLAWFAECQAVRIRQESFGPDSKRLARALLDQSA
jgi:hypothetical protein